MKDFLCRTCLPIHEKRIQEVIKANPNPIEQRLIVEIEEDLAFKMCLQKSNQNENKFGINKIWLKEFILKVLREYIQMEEDKYK